MLTRDQFLDADDRKSKTVKALGGEVRLLEMTGLERGEYEDIAAGLNDGAANQLKKMAAIIVFTIADENGERIFGADDIDAVSKKGFSTLNHLFAESLKVNALTKGEIDSLGKD